MIIMINLVAICHHITTCANWLVVPALISQREDCKMALASTSVLVVGWAPQNGCCQHLCPQSEPQLPPASPGGSPRLASGSDSGSFQITASALGPGACEILCAPFKSGVYFPQPSSSPESKLCWPSKPNVLGAHLPGAGLPGWGAQCGAQTLCSLGRTSAIVIIFCCVGHLPGGMGLDCTTSPLLLPVSLWFLFYIFSCRRSFLLVFRSFSLIVAL